LDATDLPAVAGLAENITELLPEAQQRLQHVVYSAGAGSGKFGFPFWNMHPADWKHVLDVNLMGAVNIAHAFSAVLRDNSAQTVDSTMLFIASIAGQMGSQSDPPYSAAKAGLINFMQVVAKDLAPFGIRANAIAPGMIQTSLNRGVWQAWNDQQAEPDKLDYEQWGQDKLKDICPLARWQTPEEIAATALFLASTGAANITGQTINVDGGIVMHS
jgi:NAD(P)-dependent dehydrogenase (short-subunit alcohol dehydrogenase family)